MSAPINEVIPDLVLTDVIIPETNDIEATRRIHAIPLDIEILALSSFQDGDRVWAMMRAGATGDVLKEPSNPTWDSPGASREILKLVIDGKSNSEIAGILVISLSMVKFHAGGIFAKMRVTNRVEAARVAMEQGLLD